MTTQTKTFLGGYTQDTPMTKDLKREQEGTSFYLKIIGLVGGIMSSSTVLILFLRLVTNKSSCLIENNVYILYLEVFLTILVLFTLFVMFFDLIREGAKK